MSRKPQGIHKEDIKSRILKKGIPMTTLSCIWGFSRVAISTCLKRSWPNVETKIAEYLELEPQSIWPDRYFADGTAKNGHHTTNYRQNLKNGNNEYADAA